MNKRFILLPRFYRDIVEYFSKHNITDFSRGCFIFLVILLVFDISAFAGLEDWKVVHFAGPGKGEGKVSSVDVSDWAEYGKYRIYACSYIIRVDLAQPGVPPPTERYLYEFVWNGTTWEKNRTVMSTESAYQTPMNMSFVKFRSDRTALYCSSYGGDIYEFINNGSSIWDLNLKIAQGVDGPRLHGFAVGERRMGGQKYLYRGNGHSKIEEYRWEGESWDLISGADTLPLWGDTSALGGGSSIYAANIAFAGGHKGSDKIYMYVAYDPSGKFHELEFTGDSWQPTALQPNIFVDHVTGRPIAFSADVGRGRNLYIASGGVVESIWRRGEWITTKIFNIESSTGESNLYKRQHAAVKAITCGRISSEDPTSIYAVVRYAQTNENYSEGCADEVIEITWNKKDKVWQRTWAVKLYDSGLSPHYIDGVGMTDMRMINGRNDEYNRLYIADHFGNIWECSIPPRSLRPADSSIIIIEPDPDSKYKGLPSILGK